MDVHSPLVLIIASCLSITRFVGQHVLTTFNFYRVFQVFCTVQILESQEEVDPSHIIFLLMAEDQTPFHDPVPKLEDASLPIPQESGDTGSTSRKGLDFWLVFLLDSKMWTGQGTLVLVSLKVRHNDST